MVAYHPINMNKNGLNAESDYSLSMLESKVYKQRNLISFFFFGLINNVVYVIFLSAAADILEGDRSIRKSTVLLANILPCLLVKLVAPYFLQIISYNIMITSCIVLSLCSLLSVAWAEAIRFKFAGIVFASLSSGLGETAFLALTTYYHGSSVVAWSSGTGAAGLVGAFYYLIFTSVMHFSMSFTLSVACILPFVMAFAYFVLLVPEHHEQRISVSEDDPILSGIEVSIKEISMGELIKMRFKMVQPLLLPYILPLFLVYFAEYTINQSIYFSLFYPLDKTPFRRYNDHYNTYGAFYQLGVFISRTFGRRFGVTNIWIFACLQGIMLAVLSGEVFFSYIGNVYIVLLLIILEGLLGGAAYVNTFCNINERVPPESREFSMAFTGIADSTGIALAGIFCLFYEPLLCAQNKICTSLRGASPSKVLQGGGQ